MIRAVLIDLSGTLHIENQAIPGCVEALNRCVRFSIYYILERKIFKKLIIFRLLRTDLHVKFVTNTTKESKRILHARLTNLGFDVDKNDIISSLGVAQKVLEARKVKPMLLLSPEAMEDFEHLKCPNTETPNCIVVGLAPTEFHYEKLNEAFRSLYSSFV